MSSPRQIEIGLPSAIFTLNNKLKGGSSDYISVTNADKKSFNSTQRHSKAFKINQVNKISIVSGPGNKFKHEPLELENPPNTSFPFESFNSSQND